MGTSEDRIAEVLGAWFESRDAEQPLDPEELIRAHPELEAELRDHFRLMDAVGATLAEDPQDLARAPSLLGPFRIELELGSGGMGIVYLAEVLEKTDSLEIGQRIALKVMHPHLFRSPGFYRRFVREGDLGLRVRHPNVIQTFAVGSLEQDGTRHHYLAMEYVEGQTLRELRDSTAPVPEALCRRIGLEVSEGLSAIHAAGAVHRDVKPENIILTPDHVAKVMDLGVAHLPANDMTLSQTGAFIGSIQYAAPEQFGGKSVDGRADTFSLGLVLYELATAVHPAKGDDMATVIQRQLHETPRPARELNPQLSPFFEELLRSLLEKDLSARPGSALDLSELLAAGEDSRWWREQAGRIGDAAAQRMRVARPTRLYGRESEVEGLNEALDLAQRGKGRVVLVEGEAGIGKTRLVEDFLAQAEREPGTRVLFGAYEPFAVSTTLHAFRTALSNCLSDEDLDGGMARHFAGAKGLVPGFAAALRGDVPLDGSAPLNTASLASALIQVVRGLARERTTVLVIDDLHYASDEGRRLFTELARAVADQRVLLIGTHRRGMPSVWLEAMSGIKHASHVDLSRLGASDLAKLLEEALGSGTMAKGLIYQIALKSDGNPLFVFEILQALKKGGFIQKKPDGGWATSEIDHTFQLPSKITDLIRGRLDGLDRVERELLDVASCLGLDFDPPVVAGVLGLAPLKCLRHLAALERDQQVIRSFGRRFAFDHPQIREAIYDGLAPALREGYHAAVVDHYLSSADRGPTAAEGLSPQQSATVALHLLWSDRPGDAQPFLDRALRETTSGGSDVPLELVEQALGLGDMLEAGLRLRLLQLKALKLQLSGDVSSADRTADEAADLALSCGDTYWQCKFHGIRGTIRLLQGQYDEAEELYSIKREVAERGGHWIELASALRLLGDLSSMRGDHQSSVGYFEEAIGLLDDLPAATTDSATRSVRLKKAESLNGLAIAFELLGNWRKSAEVHAAQLELRRMVGDESGEATVWHNLGLLKQAQGHFAEARSLMERALNRRREWVDRINEARTIGSLAVVSSDLGELEAALTLHRSACDTWSELGAREEEALASLAYYECLATLGQREEASTHIHEIISISEEIESPRLEANARLAAGLVLSEERKGSDASHQLEAAAQMFRQFGEVRSEARALHALGRLASGGGDREQAAAYLVAAEGIAQDNNLVDLLLVSRSALAFLGVREVEPVKDLVRAQQARTRPASRMIAQFDLFKATRVEHHLQEARLLLDQLVEAAPEPYRESMLTNVELHREIMEAWEANR